MHSDGAPHPGRYSVGLWSGWSTLVLLALGISGYTLWLLQADPRPSFVVALFDRSPLAAMVHLVCSPVALLTGALQINRVIRNRNGSLHRWLGRLYVAAVFLGGGSGLVLAFGSFGGPVTHWGFGLMAVLWLVTTGSGFWAIRRNARNTHRDWMIRSYAITLAAITLRVYIPTSQVAGIPFEDAYRAIAWLCWVPNLLLAEWFIRRLPRPA